MVELATKLGRAEPSEEAAVVLVPQGSLYAVEVAEVLEVPGFDWGPLAALAAPRPSAPLGKEEELQIEEHPPLAFSGGAGEGEVQNPLVIAWEAPGWYLERICQHLQLQAGRGI